MYLNYLFNLMFGVRILILRDTLHLVLSVWRVLPEINDMYYLNLFHKISTTIHCH